MANKRWFGVKTLYRSRAQGLATGKDRQYRPGITLVEERLVLFRARASSDALRQAEREARKYARDRFRNAYGQRVVTEYLGYCEAYDMSPDEPGLAVEVFSAMEVLPASIPTKQIVRRCFGYRESNREILCRNLGDIVFQKPASGVRLSKQEEAFVARGKAVLNKRGSGA